VACDGVPVLSALGAGYLPAAPLPNSPTRVALAAAAVSAAAAAASAASEPADPSEAAGSCSWLGAPAAADEAVSEPVPELVQALQEHCTEDMLAKLSVSDLSQVCPATAAALQERLVSGRPDLVQQVLCALVGE
jgi:hypothetical protein